MLSVVDFEPRHASAWRRLNEAWLEEMFTVEPKDRLLLDDPEGEILAKGGRILMAELDGRPVGCCALTPMADGGWELGKMTTDSAVRGRGVGRALLERAVAAARETGAHRLFLETNHRCTAAIALYEQTGFARLDGSDLAPSAYARADVFMALPL